MNHSTTCRVQAGQQLDFFTFAPWGDRPSASIIRTCMAAMNFKAPPDDQAQARTWINRFMPNPVWQRPSVSLR